MVGILVSILLLINIQIQISYSQTPAVTKGFQKLDVSRKGGLPEKIVLDECHNYDNNAVELNFDRINDLWYPLLTSREPQTRSCGRLVFTKNIKSLDYEVLLEDGRRRTGKLSHDGRFRLSEAESNSITYFLSTDYMTYLVTYFCKIDGKKFLESKREWYTIYGVTRADDVRVYESLVRNQTGINLKFYEIEQKNCKVQTPLSRHCLQFHEEDIVKVDFNKISGNWTLRASSIKDSHYFHSYSLSEPVGDKLKSTIFLGSKELGTGSISRVVGSRVLKREIYNDKAYAYTLYKDDDYFIAYVCPVDDNSEIFKSGLRVFARNSVPFDLENIIDILLNKLKSNVTRAISNQIFNLEIVNEDLLTFSSHGRNFTEEELASVNFEKMSKFYDLRYSTDVSRKFDNLISSVEGNKLRTSRLKDSEIIKNISEYHVFDSKRIYRVANKRYAEVSYLYADENYLFVYEYYQPEENLRLYARQGAPLNNDIYNKIIQQIAQTALKKIEDLLPRIRPKYNSSDNVTSGDWKASNVLNSKENSNSDTTKSVADGDKPGVKKYFNATEVDKVTYSKSDNGSNVLNSKSAKNDGENSTDLYGNRGNSKAGLNGSEIITISERSSDYTPVYLPGCKRYNESDLVDVDFTRDSGKWILKHYWTNDTNYVCEELISKLNGSDLLNTEYFRRKVLSYSTIQHINGSRVLKRSSLNGEGRNIHIYNNYVESRVVYTCDTEGTNHLLLFVREDVQCNASNNNCLNVLSKINPSVLEQLGNLTKDMKPNVLPYLEKCRKFNDNKLYDIDVERNSGKWELRLSSVVGIQNLYDEIQVNNSTLDGTAYLQGQRVTKFTLETIRASRMVRAILPILPNDELRVAVLYNDPDKYLVLYTCYSEREGLRVWARNAVEHNPKSYEDLLAKVDPTNLAAVDDLVKGLKSIKIAPILPQCKPLNESHVLKVDFAKDSGVWILRQTNNIDKKYLSYGSRGKLNGQNLNVRQITIDGQELSQINKSHIYGSHVLYTNSSENGEGREMNLYNDYIGHKVTYTCDSNVELLRVFSRSSDPTKHKSTEYDKIIAKIPESVQKALHNLFDNLNPTTPYSDHCRKFFDHETIDVDFEKISDNSWQLILTSNTNGKQLAYNTNSDQFDNSTLISLRSLGNQVRSQTSRNRLDKQSKTRHMSGITSLAKYLYQDKDYVFIYECNEVRTRANSEAIEYLRLFSRKGTNTSPADHQKIISFINPSAKNKIRDLIENLKEVKSE